MDGYSGICAPSDAWTGAVPASLYTTEPYDPSYDAGLSALGAELYNNPSGGSGGESWLITGATVSAIGRDAQGYLDTVYVEDAAYTVLVHDDTTTTNAELGDKVGFATDSTWSISGERQVFETSGWTVMSSGNPVFVEEAAANAIDYSLRLNQVTHAYGELERVSANDCGAGFACYILAHEGTEDLVRVDVDFAGPLGLGADYDGGLCAELVAPISAYIGASGEVWFYDVNQPELMRTWAGP